MKKSARALIGTAAGMIALAANAGPALASGFTLNLAMPPAVVAHPIVLNATGTIPVDDIQFPYWFSLDAIPTAVTTTCPSDRWEGVQFAQATGGSVVVLSQRVTPDAAGQFTIPVAITPTAPGSVLLCGYTDDGETNTLARTSLLVDIAPASAPSPGRPPSPPVQAAQEIRGCHALLGGAGGRRCVRRAVKHAQARCRHYRSHRRQARCLSQVRKVVRAER